MKFFLLIASVLACANGAVFSLPRVPMLDGKIVGGVPINISEAPYQVALLLDYSNIGSFSQSCGGSIISKTVVLTAAHCTDGTRSQQWKVRAGSTFHGSGGQVVAVASFIQHPKYNTWMDNDISILFLSAPLNLGPNVAVISLTNQDQEVADGSSVVVTGWGTLTEGGSLASVLYKVVLPIINQSQCVWAYAFFNPVTSNMICAGKLKIGGQDACQGDSGGPLVVNNTLAGITSWGNGCARLQYPGVYTRVASFTNWIKSKAFSN